MGQPIGLWELRLQTCGNVTVHGYIAMNPEELWEPFFEALKNLKLSILLVLGQEDLTKFEMPGLPLIHCESPAPMEEGNLIFIVKLWQGVWDANAVASFESEMKAAYPKYSVWVFVG
jgi:hypothetical protein